MDEYRCNIYVIDVYLSIRYGLESNHADITYHLEMTEDYFFFFSFFYLFSFFFSLFLTDVGVCMCSS